MMMSLAISIVAYSCKKEKRNEEPLPANATYLPLKTGNYWVYQRFEATHSGSLNPLNEYDSCYVEKDTLIAGHVYFKMYSHNPVFADLSIKYLRDSLHYIINSNGDITFSALDFSTPFNSGYLLASPSDTICSYVAKMEDKDIMTWAPAGIFPTSSFRNTSRFYPNWVVLNQHERQFNVRYSKNVGIITESFPGSFMDSVYMERRLVRYKLN